MSLPAAVSRVARLSFSPLAWLRGSFGRWPKVAAVVSFLLLALAAAGGAHLWARSEEAAARRAVKEERYDDARGHVEHCLTVWPRSASTHLLAARVARLQSDFPRAEAELREYVRLNGGASAASQLEWLLMRAQAGDVDEVAGGLMLLVKEDDPESEAILETLSGVYVRQMRLAPARVCLVLWLRRDPDSVAALDRRGWLMERLDARDLARASWERVLELAPERWQTRLRLVERLLDDSDPAAALPHIEVLLRTQPDRPEVHTALGRCRFLQGDLPGAREALDRALDRAPGDVPALLWRARVDLQEARYAEAEAGLRTALKEDPYSRDANYSLWQCLRERPGRTAEAEAQRRKCERLDADAKRLTSLMQAETVRERPDPDACAEVGELLVRVGQKALGVQWLERALSQDENCKRAHQALAAYYEQEGDAEQARKHRLEAEGKQP